MENDQKKSKKRIIKKAFMPFEWKSKNKEKEEKLWFYKKKRTKKKTWMVGFALGPSLEGVSWFALVPLRFTSKPSPY